MTKFHSKDFKFTEAMGKKDFSDPTFDDEFLLQDGDDKNNNDTERVTLEEDEGL